MGIYIGCDVGTVSVKAAVVVDHTARKVSLPASGALKRFVNIFLDDEDVRYRQGLDTPVPDGSTLVILPAVAGG